MGRRARFSTQRYAAEAMARPVLFKRDAENAMQKSQRVLLHLACLIRKAVRGRDCRWHWQHLIREFGLGEYADRKPRLKRCNLENFKCST
jgi:hypothetical protein